MPFFLSQLLTYVFVFIIYLFIYAIIRMIFLDIRTMYRKKTGGLADAYLKLINLRHKLDFFVDESYEISDNEVIGRGKKCDICIADKYMSMKNSRIFKISGKFYLEDMGSTNGTFLNGTEVLPGREMLLSDNDEIRLATIRFSLKFPCN